MFEPYNPYNPYSPYFGYNQQPQQPQQMSRQPQMTRQPQAGLQGKIVDSLDVVKATDIPYDGSVSYFPLTDHSAIITKQLQQDGTSKMVVYKPILENEEVKPKYITDEELQDRLKQLDNASTIKDIKDLKEELKNLKRKLEDISDDLKDKKEK